jgi:integrase
VASGQEVLSIAGPPASSRSGWGGRGIGVHSLRKTAINDAICNGAGMHEVREFAGHADIRTTELYFVRKEEDADEVAAHSDPRDRPQASLTSVLHF